MLDSPGFNSRDGKEIHFFWEMLRVSLRPSKPVIHWEMGVHYPRLEWLVHEFDHPCPPSDMVKNELSCASFFLLCHNLSKPSGNFTYHEV
jgi:hypothetical protein